MNNKTKYPESKKIKGDDYEGITAFLDFLKENGYEVRKRADLDFLVDVDALIYEFLAVDVKELEKERRSMLEAF